MDELIFSSYGLKLMGASQYRYFLIYRLHYNNVYKRVVGSLYKLFGVFRGKHAKKASSAVQ
jgi:hypothetical protein